MFSDRTRKVVATKAWSQLVTSLVSLSPPTDMSSDYYTEAKTKHKYQPGIEYIQDCIRSTNDYYVVKASDQREDQQGIEYVRDCIRSTNNYVVKASDQREDRQGIEYVQDCIRSTNNYVMKASDKREDWQGIEYVQYCIRSTNNYVVNASDQREDRQGIEYVQDCIQSTNDYYYVVQANEGENQQGIGNIQACMRSANHYGVLQARVHKVNKDDPPITKFMCSKGLPRGVPEPEIGNQQWIHHQVKEMSTLFNDLFKFIESYNMNGVEKPTLRFQVLEVIKLLHHYGIDTIRSGVEEELEYVNQINDAIAKNSATHYKKKALEVMLRICDIETCQSSIYEVIGADRSRRNAQIKGQIFTFRELAAATNNFRPECFLGGGGFGRVYKGRLQTTGQVVAVKQLDRDDGLQGNREFLVEVLMLSLLHHSNIVNLIGYCADGDQRLLVYEFMPLGTLEDHLHDLPPDKEPLDWNTRMKIAAGAAKGLEFLHDQTNPAVIYTDFKSSNILLEEGFHPKLSDFGLAKFGPPNPADKSYVSTRVMGTYGYVDPEYAMTGQLTLKSDIYSFGVVLLELITGRKSIDSTQSQGQQNLVTWARPLFNRKNFEKLADPRLQGQYPMRGLYQAIAVASMCIQEQAAARPPIGDVVTALSYIANQAYDPSSAPGHGYRLNGDRDKEYNRGSGRYMRNDIEGGPGFKWDLEETAWMLNRNLERERAVAEAKMWGENLREKKRQQDNFIADNE